MGQTTTLEQRHQIKEMLDQSYSNVQISMTLGLSISTVKKWRRRISQGSISAQMGRPRRGSLSSFSPLVRSELIRLRNDHEGWGPATLQLELAKLGIVPATELPGIASIARYLKEQSLIKTYQRHSALPCTDCQAADKVHRLWEIDGKGNHRIKGVGYIALLSAKDVYAKTYVAAYPALMPSQHGHPNTDDYQTMLRHAFAAHGLPEQIQTDHASVFYDNRSKSPFPTRFHLWLVALGINLCYSRVNRPTDQPHVERSHRTISAQALQGQEFLHWGHVFDYLKERRRFLNEEFPSASLDHKAPFEAYPEARHSGRYYHPMQETQLMSMERVGAYLAKGKWFREVASSKTVSLGGQVYYVAQAKPKQQLRIEYAPKEKMFCFFDDKEQVVAMSTPKDIDIQHLCGRAEPSEFMRNFQLEIPFQWNLLKHNVGLRLFDNE
jgi:transposase InsO family protein